MSDIDLTKAVEAGENAYRAAYFNGNPGAKARATAVTAAAPLIEQAVREQVARDLEVLLVRARADGKEADAKGWHYAAAWHSARRDALRDAAHIARGEP